MTQPTIASIQAAVCERYGITRQDMLAQDRSWENARPRQLAMYLARHLTSRSYGEIGNMFQRHPTTVEHAVSRAADKIADGTIDGGTLQAIRSQLGAA